MPTIRNICKRKDWVKEALTLLEAENTGLMTFDGIFHYEHARLIRVRGLLAVTQTIALLDDMEVSHARSKLHEAAEVHSGEINGLARHCLDRLLEVTH